MTTADGRIAFLFPGSYVKVPMGAALAGSHPATARRFEEARALLGYPIYDLMSTGPLDALRRPTHALPAAFLASITVFYALIENGVKPDVLAGRSVGDITAAAASGAISFATGLRLVKAKGKLFESAYSQGLGSMAVIMGLARDEVQALCGLAAQRPEDVCEISSINTPNNFYVSGTRDSVDKMMALARERNASTQPIPLAMAYHSSLMKDIGREFSRTLADAAFQDPVWPLVLDHAGGITRSGREVRDLLASSTSRCVDWERRIRSLEALGISKFLELGPDQGMARFASQLQAGSSGRNIETYADVLSLR